MFQMEVSRRSRLRLLAAAAVLIGVPVLAAPPAGSNEVPGPEEREVHCSVTVTGMRPSGELITTKPVCTAAPTDQRPAATAAVMARHYTGTGFTGSTYTVNGVCNGGYINFPVAWTTVISSTWSNCTVSHFDYFYATGPVEVTYGPADLTSLNDRTNSAVYA